METPRKRPFRKALSTLLSILMVMGCISAAFTAPTFATAATAAMIAHGDYVTVFEPVLTDLGDAIELAVQEGAMNTATFSGFSDPTATGANQVLAGVITDNSPEGYILEAVKAFQGILDPANGFLDRSTAGRTTDFFPFSWWSGLFRGLRDYYVDEYGWAAGGQEIHLLAALTSMKGNDNATLTLKSDQRYFIPDGSNNTSGNNNTASYQVTVQVNRSELTAIQGAQNYADVLALKAAEPVLTSYRVGFTNSSQTIGSTSARYRKFPTQNPITPAQTSSIANVDRLIAFNTAFIASGVLATNPFEDYTLSQLNTRVANNTTAWAAWPAGGLAIGDLNRFFTATKVQEVQDFMAECLEAQALMSRKPNIDYFMKRLGFITLVEKQEYKAMNQGELDALWAEQATHYAKILELSAAMLLMAATSDVYDLDLDLIVAAQSELRRYMDIFGLQELKAEIDEDYAAYGAYLAAYAGVIPADPTDQPAWDEYEAYKEAYFADRSGDYDTIPEAGFTDDEIIAYDARTASYVTRLSAYLNSEYYDGAAAVAEVFTDGYDYVYDLRNRFAYEKMRRGVEDSGTPYTLRNQYIWFNRIRVNDQSQRSTDELIDLISEAATRRADFIDKMNDAMPANPPAPGSLTYNSWQLMYESFLPKIDDVLTNKAKGTIGKLDATLIGRLTAWVDDALQIYDGRFEVVDYENVVELRRIFANLATDGIKIYDYLKAAELLDDALAAKLASGMRLLMGDVSTLVPNPNYDPDEFLPNPDYDPDEFLPNPDYDPVEFLPNPNYDPDEFEEDGITPNPDYDPDEFIPNPDYDPDEFIPNPDYDPDEFIPNPDYDPDETIPYGGILKMYLDFVGEQYATDKYNQKTPDYPVRLGMDPDVPYPDLARALTEDYAVSNANLEGVVSKLDALLGSPAFRDLVGMDLPGCVGGMAEGLMSDSTVNMLVGQLYPIVLEGLEEQLQKKTNGLSGDPIQGTTMIPATRCTDNGAIKNCVLTLAGDAVNPSDLNSVTFSMPATATNTGIDHRPVFISKSLHEMLSSDNALDTISSIGSLYPDLFWKALNNSDKPAYNAYASMNSFLANALPQNGMPTGTNAQRTAAWFGYKTGVWNDPVLYHQKTNGDGQLLWIGQKQNADGEPLWWIQETNEKGKPLYWVEYVDKSWVPHGPNTAKTTKNTGAPVMLETTTNTGSAVHGETTVNTGIMAKGNMKFEWGIDNPPTTGPLSTMTKQERFYTAMAAAFDGIFPLLEALFLGKEFEVLHTDIAAGTINVAAATFSGQIFFQDMDLSIAVNEAVYGYAEILTPFFEGVLGITPSSTAVDKNGVRLYSLIPSLTQLAGFTEGIQMVEAIFNPLLGYFDNLAEAPLGSLLGILPNLAYTMMFDRIVVALKTLNIDLTVAPDDYMRFSGGLFTTNMSGTVNVPEMTRCLWERRPGANSLLHANVRNNPLKLQEISCGNALIDTPFDVYQEAGGDKCFSCLNYPDSACRCLMNPNGCIGCLLGGMVPSGMPCLKIGEMVQYGEMDVFNSKRPPNELVTYAPQWGSVTVPTGAYEDIPVVGSDYAGKEILRDDSVPMVQRMAGDGVTPVPDVQAEDEFGVPLYWAQATDEFGELLFWEEKVDEFGDPLFLNQKVDGSGDPLFWEQEMAGSYPLFWTDETKTTKNILATDWPVLIEVPFGSGDPVMEETTVPSAEPVFTGGTTTTANAYPVKSDTAVTTDVTPWGAVMVPVLIAPPMELFDENDDLLPAIDADPLTGLPFYGFVTETVPKTVTQQMLTGYTKETAVGAATGFHIDPDEGDMLLFLLRYLLKNNVLPGLLGGLLGGDDDDDAIMDMIADILAGAADNTDDAIAALVELFFPQPYAVSFVNYGEPEFTDAKFPAWWAGRLGLDNPTAQEKAKMDGDYIVANANVLLDVVLELLMGVTFTDLIAPILDILEFAADNLDDLYAAFDAILTIVLGDPNQLEAVLLDLFGDAALAASLAETLGPILEAVADFMTDPLIRQLLIIDGEPVDFGAESDIPNPNYDPDEFLPNPDYDPDEFLPNPDYDPVEFLPNPNYDPDEFEADGITPNPDYDPVEFLPNPDYDPVEFLPNPDYDPVEFLPNPDYDPRDILPTPLYAVNQLLNFLFCGADLEILDISNDSTPEGLIKVLGYNGYELALVPMLKTMTDPLGLSNLLVSQADFSAADLKGKFKAIAVPVLAIVEKILDNPVDALLEMIPNLVYFLAQDKDGKDSPLQQSLDNLLKPLYVLIDTVRPLVDLQDLLEGLLGGSLDDLLGGLLEDLNIADLLADLDLDPELTALLEGLLENLSLASLGLGFDLNNGGLRVDLVVLYDFIAVLIPDILAALGLDLPLEINFNILDFLVGTLADDTNVVPSKYLKADKAAVLFALLDTLGLIDLIEDMEMEGLTKMIQYGKFPNPEKVDYAMAPAAATVAAPPKWFHKTNHAQFLVDNVDGVLAWAWDALIAGDPQMKGYLGDLIGGMISDGLSIPLGDSLSGTLDEFFGNETYTVGGLLLLANMLYDLKDLLDEFMLLELGDITIDLADLLSKLVWIYDETSGYITPLDLAAIFDHVANFIVDLENGVTVIADEDDFKQALADLCAPLVPVLRLFLSESNIMLIRDERIIGTQTDPAIDPNLVGFSIADEGLLRVYGYNGYESLLTILLGIGADVPGFIDQVKSYADFKALPEADQLLAILDPILFLLHALLDNPIQTLFQVLPNLAYLIGDSGNDGDTPLLAQALSNIIHPLTVLLDLLPPGLLGEDIDDALSMVTDLNLGGLLNEMIADLLADIEEIDAFTVESLVVGTIELLDNGFNTIGKDNLGSYVDVDLANLLIQLLHVTGLFELIEDTGLQGLVELLNYEGRAAGTLKPVEYPAVNLVGDLYNGWSWSRRDAISMAGKMPGLIDELLKLLFGETLESLLRGMLGDSLFTEEVFYDIVGALQEFLVDLDLNVALIPGETEDDPPVITLGDLLEGIVEIGGKKVDVLGILDDLKNWQASGEITADNFIRELASFLTPVVPLLDWLLFGADIVFLPNVAYVNDGKGLLKAFGYQGYQYGLIPILEALLIPLNAESMIPWAVTLKNKPDTEKLIAILEPLLFAVDKVMDDPLNNLMKLLPNLFYFAGAKNADGTTPLEQSVNNLLYAATSLIGAVMGTPADVGGLLALLGIEDFDIGDIGGLLDGMLYDFIGVENLGSILMKNLLVGTVDEFYSMSGARARVVTLRGEGDMADLYTALLRTLLDLVQSSSQNRNAVVTALTNMIIPEGQFGNYAVRQGLFFFLWVSRMLGTEISLDSFMNLVNFLAWFMPLVNWVMSLFSTINGWFSF